MGKSTRNFIIFLPMVLLFFFVIFESHPRFCKGGSDGAKVVADGACIGDCLWKRGMMKMEMDSEASRRWLLQSRRSYISYEALKGDAVPCSRPGAPYYNCHALPRANPYTRGCSVITGCARDMSP